MGSHNAVFYLYVVTLRDGKLKKKKCDIKTAERICELTLNFKMCPKEVLNAEKTCEST